MPDPSPYAQLADQSIGKSPIFQKFRRMAEKYAKLNEIPLHYDERDYDAMLFSFLKDPIFIDSALDQCGIKFNSELFASMVKASVLDV